jgi:hypothetical protein
MPFVKSQNTKMVCPHGVWRPRGVAWNWELKATPEFATLMIDTMSEPAIATLDESTLSERASAVD